MIKGKKILITGAGGSIGSELVRQIAKLSPSHLYLLDYSEFLLYEIEQECIQKFPGIKFDICLTDIRNKNIVNKIFSSCKPDLVFHAAALKHVPLLEKHKIEAIKTNIFGTKNILNASIKNGTSRFVFISTDKAVDPISFMGSTKRIAELFCQTNFNNKIIVSIVRFGNVLGSNGSVVPLFQKQIAAGGPVTVTDKSATRYFMTIPEAVGLVLQAATLNKSLKQSKTFVLDMGKPIEIYKLAKQMITLAGLKPNEDIEIKFIGLRPGEKLHEILVTEQEPLTETIHKEIFIAQAVKLSKHFLSNSLIELKSACNIYNELECIKIIKLLIAKVNK